MVTLPRRLAALVIALVAAASLVGPALGSPRDVINDFLDNQQIDGCHTQADYEAARDEPVDVSYGDLQGAIDVALTNPQLVGTAERPCPAAGEADTGSSTGTVAIVAVVAGLGLLAGGGLIARRRRAGAGAGTDDEDGADG